MTTGDDEGCRQAVRYGDQQVERGHGSETHQIAAEGGPWLTTQQGTVVSDHQNTRGRRAARARWRISISGRRSSTSTMSGSRSGWCTPAGTGARCRPRLPPPGPVGRHHRPRLPPSGSFGLQLFGDDFADRFGFDILDPTKIVPEEQVPVRRVGRLVLDRVVDNFFAETEQVAFGTQNIIPGIDFTNDPLLRGRNFSYLDTQLKRLGGPNFTHLPVNAPKCPIANFQQDGHMAMANPQGRVNYEPSSWDPPGPREDPVAGFAPTPTGRATRPGPSGGCGRRASPTTTARPGSSSSARPRPSSSTSPTPSCSSSASAARPPSAAEWWPRSATWTRTWPVRSPTASAWPSCWTPCRRPASRSGTWPPPRR